MEEDQKLSNVTTCSECITITLTVPRECRMDADGIAKAAAGFLSSDTVRHLCRGCPLQIRIGVVSSSDPV